MPFFVTVMQQVQENILDDVLGNMRANFAASRRDHPGRRTTRVFQRLNHPTHLLTIGEWDSQADYERLRRTPRYQAETIEATPPARIEYLKRLRMFARMSSTPAVFGCVTIEAAPEYAAELEPHLLAEVSPSLELSADLLVREVYRIGDEPGRALVVHGWRTLADLERFRQGAGKRHDSWLDERGISIRPFTAMVAVQFSRLEAPA